MDDAMLGELLAMVGVFNRTKRAEDAYQVEVDDAIRATVRGV
jgi:hypothetical protein